MDEVSASPESPAERFTEWAARLFDPAGRHAKPEALRGIRVLDLSVIIFGPATADFLEATGRIRDRMDVLDYTYTNPVAKVDPALVEVEGQWQP